MQLKKKNFNFYLEINLLKGTVVSIWHINIKIFPIVKAVEAGFDLRPESTGHSEVAELFHKEGKSVRVSRDAPVHLHFVTAL